METLYEVSLTVNGRPHRLRVPARRKLVDCLRDDLGLTGTKIGCGAGECGACTVLMDGLAVNSCLVLAVEADGCAIETIEGQAKAGRLTPLQSAFVQEGAAQCGFCTPGMIMSATALFRENPRPDEVEITKALEGNFCRCTGYGAIKRAVKSARPGEEES